MVVTDAEGPSEILTDAENALLVPRGDPEALAGALGRLLEQPDLRARLAHQALAKARQVYALEVVGARLSEALGEVVQTAGSGPRGA